MLQKLFTTILMSALILLMSCSTRVMDFTLISSKNVELSKFPTYERGFERVEGKDTKQIIIIIPTGNPDGKEAIDRAIESTPGAVALVDGVLTYKWFYIPYIYGEATYVIEGTPLIDPSISGAAEINQLNEYSVCLLDKEGSVLNTIQYDKNEYVKIRDEIFASPKDMYNKLKK
ncbi:MAG: hypothetical protein GF313_01025 [Caldithrix sp.]|nr:hypothetical protein [Caldithrix sp.]